MKTTIKISVTALLMLLSLAFTNLKAQDNPVGNRTTLSIETDPSTFAFGGYAFHFRIKPAGSQHLVIGAGTYALDYPDFLVGMNADNKDKGWKVRINSAYSAFGEYYFKEANRGWLAGLQVGIQNYKIKNDNIPGKDNKYSNLLIMPSIGYTWLPFKSPLYVKPWMGLGYTSKMSGENVIDNLTYHISSVVPFVTMHVGYTF